MATYREFENKLLSGFSKDVIYIDLKPETQWSINGFEWPTEVSIPIYMDVLAEKIKVDDVEKIPPIAILKGIIHALGSLGEDLKHYEVYVKFLAALDDAFVLSLIQDGIRFADEEELPHAILYFRVLTLVRPERTEGWFYRGRAYYDLALKQEQQTFFMSAEYNLRKAISIDDDMGMAYYLLGYCQYALEKYPDADVSWKMALKCDVEKEIKEELIESLAKIDAHLKFEEGVDLILNERVTEGLELLLTLEDEHDDWWKLLFFIGLGMRFQELYEDAIGYFLKTLLLNSGDIQTMNELGLCYLALGDLEEAEKQYLSAHKLSPENAEIMCNLGIVYLNKGDLDEAQACFKEAKQLNPEDQVIDQWLQHIRTLS